MIVYGRDEEACNLAFASVKYVQRFIGRPYLWGGNDAVGGFDCSGVAVEMLQRAGKISHRADYTADGLMQKYFDAPVDRSSFRVGALVFYGRNEHATHVGILVRPGIILEAGGGGRDVRSRQDAIEKDAFIRERPLDYRSDFLGIYDPFACESDIEPLSADDIPELPMREPDYRPPQMEYAERSAAGSTLKVTALDRLSHFTAGRWQGLIGGLLLIGAHFVTGSLSTGFTVLGGTLAGNEVKKEVVRKTGKFGKKGEANDKEFWKYVVRMICDVLGKIFKRRNKS